MRSPSVLLIRVRAPCFTLLARPMCSVKIAARGSQRTSPLLAFPSAQQPGTVQMRS
jgi:hypothetical protein